MVFEPISLKSTVEIVVERLEERILDGTFKSGDMLPSEAQLSAQLGIGRRAIREALKILEMKGLLETRTGVGSFVKRNDLDNFLSALSSNVRSYLRINKADVQHVVELRLLLEGAALELLAKTRDSATFQKLAEAINQQKQAVAKQDFPLYQDWHFRFHHEIVQVLNNPLIRMIHEQTLALMRPTMVEVGSRPEVTVRAIEEHEELLRALEQGATDNLKGLLVNHLNRFMSYLDPQEAQPPDGSAQLPGTQP